nr:transcription initiation factor TFIID subunit 8-like isoform X2 [Nicotiana tomentosiformis]
MNNGGKAESEKEKENRVYDDRKERASTDDFGQAISRTAAAQICENIGFEGFNESALESFADITVKYLCDLGKTATFCAILVGRTEVNVFDVIQGLGDLGVSTGASKVKHCGLDSRTIKGIVEFVKSAQEIPFSQPLPCFPVIKDKRKMPSFIQMNETTAFKHIPLWLPAFPDRHTYVRTSTWNERTCDPRADKVKLARQRRKAERSLLNLQQRLVCNGSTEVSASNEPDDVRIESSVDASGNAFVAVSSEAREKDMAAVSLAAKLSNETDKNHVSLPDIYSPAIETLKDDPSETGNGVEENPPDQMVLGEQHLGSGGMKRKMTRRGEQS